MISLGLLKETFKEFQKDNAMRLSAALAYYSVFSLAPLLIISISIAGAIFGEDAARGAIEFQLTDAIGQESARAVQEMIQNAHQDDKGIFMTIIGVLILLVSASGVFAQLKDAMNTVWDLKVKPGTGVKVMVKSRLLALSMVLVIGFLLLISLILSTVTATLISWVGKALPIPGFVFQTVSLLVSVGMVTVLFAMIFKILPDADVQWRDVWSGAFLTAVLFSIGKMVLALYLGRQEAASTYGAAGALILLLSWVYYSANILLLGAEFTQVYARRRGRRIEPTSVAVRLH
ncbi:YihY/virulence factor BrkB family protein [Luteolibacter algae]|uniref:YihY/virulence factor BrkB family protein n=1 Tax=Luteolibacter algae TaxID=454151 RepID=A0ABW5D3N9_9BACT